MPYNNGAKGVYRKKTVPVDLFEPNPWGLHQMHGNVYEWCGTDLGPYKGAYRENPVFINNGDWANIEGWRVYRGGSFYSSGSCLRSAHRDGDEGCIAHAAVGFRVARMLYSSEEIRDSYSDEGIAIELEYVREHVEKCMRKHEQQ